jgi:hypothetical protein
VRSPASFSNYPTPWGCVCPACSRCCPENVLNREKKKEQLIRLPMDVHLQFYPIKFLKPYKFIRDYSYISFLFPERRSKHVVWLLENLPQLLLVSVYRRFLTVQAGGGRFLSLGNVFPASSLDVLRVSILATAEAC